MDPYAAKSDAPGSVLGNIGLTQDVSELGIPATLGIGFLSSAGGIVDFRQQPESNGTNTGLTVFAMPVMLGVQLTERLSVGGGGSLGIGLFDGPFIGVGGLTTAYALRGTAGLNYQLTEVTSVGAYYQSKQSFQFENAITLPVGPGNPLDVNLDLPRNVGVGVANTALLDGRLLVGVDLLYKFWDQADLFSAIYDNQLAVQLGTQWTHNRVRLRAGYVWAENPLDPNPGPNLGGVIQSGGLPSVRYSQALLAITSEHRLSFGLGITDVLPGIDADLMGGGMFKDTEQLGPFTQTSIESYWLGFGSHGDSREVAAKTQCHVAGAQTLQRQALLTMAREVEPVAIVSDAERSLYVESLRKGDRVDGWTQRIHRGSCQLQCSIATPA